MATRKKNPNLTLDTVKPAEEKKTTRKRGLTREEILDMLGLKPDDAMVVDLTMEEIQFCHEMVSSGMNREYAYRQAFKAKAGEHGISSQTVSKRVYKLLQKDVIRKFLRYVVEKSMGQYADNLDAQLLNTYMQRAFYDVGDYLCNDGDMRPITDIPLEKRCVIDGIETRYYGKDADVCVRTYKLANRAEALKALADYADMIRKDSFSHVSVVDNAAKDEDMESIADMYADMDDDELDAELRKIGGGA